MTKRDAPLTFFGNGFPAGSAVRRKSRFRLYSSSAISCNVTADNRRAREVVEAVAAASGRAPPRLPQTPLQQLRFVWQGLADEVADEAANHNIFAELGNFRVEQIADCYVGIFYESLLEQTDGAVKFLEFSVHDLIRDMRGFIFDLRFVDFAF